MDDMFENKNSADAGNSEPGFSEKAKEGEPVSFDARQQNFDDTAEPVMSVDAQADGTSQQEQPNTDVQPNFSGIYNDGFNTPPCTINYTPITAVKDYKPVSRGLKYFAAVLAGVILLTAASAGGYFLGRSSVRSVSGGNAKIELAAKPAKTDEKTAAEVYEDVKASVVGIMVYNTAGQGSQASGVFYSSDGYIVTNDHIYAEVPSAKFKIYTSDNKEYDAQYVAGDQVSDLAVLKIEGSGFKAAQFGDSAQLNFGESVVAIGRPSDATDDSSITKGIISSVGRRVRTTSNYSAKLIQTDSAINPGSSGGALVNMYSQVVGITSSKLAGTEYDAVGYAIPTRTVKRIVSELISKGKVVSRARLGITYTAINSVTAEINGYSSVGLYVASVSEDSDLHGKVAKGDVITRINNIEVTSDDIVLDIIEECSAGDTISVTVLTKGGAEKTFDAVLKANTGESSYSTKAPSSSNSESGNSSSSGGTFDFPFGE